MTNGSRIESGIQARDIMFDALDHREWAARLVVRARENLEDLIARCGGSEHLQGEKKVQDTVSREGGEGEDQRIRITYRREDVMSGRDWQVKFRDFVDQLLAEGAQVMIEIKEAPYEPLLRV